MKQALVVLMVLVGVGYLVKPLRAQTFTSGQDASGVIGQTSFTTAGYSNLPNRLDTPRATAFDAANGKVYVVDSGNHRVLRFSIAATEQIGAMPEAVFGQANFTGYFENRGLGAPTDSTLYFPRGVLLDSRGRLWIADGNNHRVLRFDNAAFLGNGAPASAVLGQAIFTTNTSGTTGSTMSGPHGLALGADDSLWVVDSFNHRVLRFLSVSSKANGATADVVVGQPNLTSGTVNQGGPTGASTLAAPIGLFLDASDNLWVGDSQNHRVLRYKAASAIAVNGVVANQVFGQADFVSAFSNRSLPRAANGLETPVSPFVDEAGSLWVADYGNKRVLRYRNAAAQGDGVAADLVLGQEDFLTGLAAAAIDRTRGPIHVGPGPEGSVIVSDMDATRVIRFDPVNLAPTIRLTGSKKITTSQSSLTLRGTAADSDGLVASVGATVNNKPVNASGTTSWSLRARLKPGINTIKLRSTDDLGLSSGFTTVTVTRR
jgi:sugar lactone lactonase YvrE